MNPFQLALQSLAATGFGLFFLLQTLGLLFQPRAVVAFPRNALAPVKLQNPSGHIVQEIAVVRNGNHRALVLLQMGFQPLDRLGIQMVGRLVQKQDVRLLQQQSA